MIGPLALLGSGEFTESVIDIDLFLLSLMKSPKVAIFPTAAGQEADYRKWIDDGIKHFTKLKVQAVGIEVIDRKNAEDPALGKKLKECNVYYFSGGNPGYLLSVLKNSLVWKVIYENHLKGAVYVGSSAGAMVMGKKVWSRVYEFVEKGMHYPWEEGLGVVNFGVIPHYDRIKVDFTPEQIEDSQKLLPKDTEVVGIDENTAYIRLNGKWLIKGKGQVHRPAFT